MKWQYISMVLVGTTIVLNPNVALTQPSFTKGTRVECPPSNQPTTFIENQSDQGRLIRIPYIEWYRVFPAPTARQLCEQATNTLRRYSQINPQFVLSPAQINGEYVMCLTRSDKEPCSAKSEKLFTLPATINREQAEKIISLLFEEGVNRSMGEATSFSTYGNRERKIFNFPIPRFRFYR